MSLPKITALVPKGEAFDATALNGEGIWLTVAHVNSIESALAGAETAGAAAVSKEKDLNSQLSTLQSEKENLTTANKTANDSLTAANIKVSDLEKKITALEKLPAAEIVNTVKDGSDVIPGQDNSKKAYLTSVDAELAIARKQIGLTK